MKIFNDSSLRYWMTHRREMRKLLTMSQNNNMKIETFICEREIRYSADAARAVMRSIRFNTRVKYFIAWIAVSVIILASSLIAKALFKL